MTDSFPEIQDAIPTTTLQALTRAEIDVAIATAKRYPRSLTAFKAKALSMATSDQDTAASCFYVLQRKESDGGTKRIEGPGVRLAEIVGCCWGNLRYGARIVDQSDKYIVAQGIAHDLEANVYMAIEVRRRITGRNGRPYSDDMIATTGNAACAIALRNAIFKVVPKTYVDSVYQAAKKVAVGDQKSLPDRRQAAVAFLRDKHGIGVPRILARIDKPGIDDIDLEDLELLHGLATAVKDGDIAIDEAFPDVATAGVATSGEPDTDRATALAATLRGPALATEGAAQPADAATGR